MCKKIISFLLTLMMISGMISIPVMAADSSANSTLVVASGDSLANLSANGTYSSMSTEATFISAQSLKLYGTGASSYAVNESKRWKFSAAQNWSEYAYINLMVKNNNSGTASKANITMSINGNDINGTNGYWTKTITVSDDSWSLVNVPLSAFTQGKTGDKTDEKYTKMTTITALTINQITGNFYVDSIWLSTSVPAAAVCTEKSVASDAANNVLMSTTDYTFTYSEKLAASTVQNASIEVTENSAACSAEYDVIYSGNKLTVSFDEMLKPSTSYSISVSGVKDRFGIVASDASLSFATSSTVVFPDEVVIADFTKIDDINNAEMDVDSEDKLFGDKSGKISQKKLDAKNVATGYFEIDSTKAPTDWSSYTHLNLWVHSEAVTEFKFAVMVRSSATVSGSSAWKHFNQDFAGWKKLSIPLSEISKGANFDPTNVVDTYVSFTYYTGNDIDALVQNFKKFSIAKIWLSTEKADGTKELFNSNSTSTINQKLANANAVFDTEVVELNDRSLKVSGQSGHPSLSTAEDWSSYNYINFRVNSTSESNKLVFYATVDGTSANYTSGFWGIVGKFTGTGWQTLSYKLDDNSQFTKVSGTLVHDTPDNISGFRIDSVTSPLYLEKIWLSTEPCIDVPELEEISVDSGAEVSAYTRKIDFKYSELLNSKLPTVTVIPEADHIVTCENDTVSVIFPDGLEAGKDYTVTVGGDVRSRYSISAGTPASVSFSTESYSAERSDSAVYARYASSEYATGRLIFAIYNDDTSLEKVEVIEDVNSEDMLTLKNDYVSIYSDQRVKVLVWDYETLEPLEVYKEF